MIVFELTCDAEHRFEGWFGSSDDFEQQKRRGLLMCPVCSSASIAKVPVAKIKRLEPEAPPAPPKSQVPVPANQATPNSAQMMAFINYLIANSENVGERFAEEARRIFHKEAPERAIRGQASREQTEELLEEGIPVLPLPIPPQSDMH
jgi:hypothetical protein